MAPTQNAKPTLPKKGAAGSKKGAASTNQLPIMHAQFITLEDGTQVGWGCIPQMAEICMLSNLTICWEHCCAATLTHRRQSAAPHCAVVK